MGMKTLKEQILASTTLDADNERIPKEILFSFYETMPSEQVMRQEHDMSKKPVAKIYNKQFRKLENGEYAIIGDVDIFDEEAYEKYKGYSISYTTERYSVFPDKQPEIEVLFNPKYFDHTTVKEIIYVSTDKLSIDVRILKHKGLETAAIIILKFIGFAYAAGFFGKAGADFYDKIKKKLKKVSDQRKAENKDETKLHFQYKYKFKSDEYDVLIELTVDQLILSEEYNISLDSAHTFIKKAVGSSEILSVTIGMTNVEPYWEILHFQDKDGKYINL